MSKVDLGNSYIKINNEYKIILCASLFYFRIPDSEWLDRIKKLKNAGYNCVDVYFPWNFHEVEPDTWDFTGQKNVKLFLDMLANEGIYVVARPGPYICSEWDGGGIPAWVLTDENIKIREYDSGFLDYVYKWYEKILPIIAEHQIDRNGTVIMVQLDNELDFFDCNNPREYMDALRDMARSFGITVPLFGCAGQCNLEGATGWADDIEPTFNFYGNVLDPEYEEKFFYYYKRLSQINKPLMITETSCNHLFLRRQLAAGAKLIGPYNQVGGTNFGLTGSINNWGTEDNPLSYIPTYYAGENMIGPAGEIKKEYLNARIFSGMINSFGASLAAAKSIENTEIDVKCNFKTNKIFHALKLTTGGQLLCIPNLDTKDGVAVICHNGNRFEVEIKAQSAPFIPFDVSTEIFGFKGILKSSNCELVSIRKNTENIEMIFCGGSQNSFVEFVIDGEKKKVIGLNNVMNFRADEKEIIVKIAPFEEICYNNFSDLDRIEGLSTYITERPFNIVFVSDDIVNNFDLKKSVVAPMEKHGVYRGVGKYRFFVDNCEGILLQGVADVILAYKNGEFYDARVSAGCFQYYEGEGEWNFITKIWGHSNFDDSRLPALRLNSTKGISKAMKVNKKEYIEENWFFSYALENDTTVPQKAVETLISVNSWNSTKIPLNVVYKKILKLDAENDCFIFAIIGNKAETSVYVDGDFVEKINPLNPYLDISAFCRGKRQVELALHVRKRNWAEPVGKPVLISGNEIKECEFGYIREQDIIDFTMAECKKEGIFPLKLQPGTMTIVELPFDKPKNESAYLDISGRDVLVIVTINNKLVGRTLLDWDRRPKIAGNYNFIYLPSSYLKENNTIRMLAFALGNEPYIDRINMKYLTTKKQ